MSNVTRDSAKRLGLLQAANRLALNPVGYALVLEPGTPNSPASLRLIGDGFQQYLTSETPEAASSAKVYDALLRANIVRRLTAHGFMVQGAKPTPIRLPFDDETVDRFMDFAEAVVEGVGVPLPPEERAKIADALILHLGRELGAHWDLYEDGTVRPRPAADESQSDVRAARARFLCREVQRMAHSRKIEDAAGNEARQEGQLYPREVEELGQLVSEFEALGAAPPSEDLDRILKRLEELYSLAAPGMLWWRGDKDARADWETRRYDIADRMDEWRKGRAELDRLLAGEIRPAQVVDTGAAIAELESRLGEARAAHAALEEQALAVSRAKAPMEAALAALRDVPSALDSASLPA